MKTAIAIFAFNRPQHLKNLIDSLLQNEPFESIPKYIFIDGPRSSNDAIKIASCRNLLEQYRLVNAEIFTSENNKGLAESIIGGVSKVLVDFESVIVLEDDLVVGKNFVSYMISALDHYKDDNRIAQVSGFIFPIEIEKKGSSLILPLTTTLGWATWRRVWTDVDFYPSDWEEKLQSRKIRYKFDLEGVYPYSKMLKRQMRNPNFGSWGVRYWWDVFKKEQYVVYPDYPLVQHRDFDLSGTHKSDYSHLDMQNWDEDYVIDLFILEENTEIFNKLKQYLLDSLHPLKRLRLYLKKIKLF